MGVVALRNLPEGLVIGVAYAGNDLLQVCALTEDIAIQDIPEGLVVVVALLTAGYRFAFAVGLGMATGMVESLGAVLGVAVINCSAALLPWEL